MVAVNKSKFLETLGRNKRSKKSSNVIATNTKVHKRGSRGKKKKSRSGNKKLGVLKKKGEELIKHEQVADAVQALLHLNEKTMDDSQLFGDEPKPIMMQVVSLRVPKVNFTRLRCKLPHPAILDTSDVCLFVRNSTIQKKQLQRKKYRKYFEPLLNYYKELFSQEGITRQIQVMPLQQLQTEYSEYEQKRRLCQQFDVFLTDVLILDQVAEHFGKYLNYTLNAAIPVKLRDGNLKEPIEEALSKTTMLIHGKGDSYAIKVGHSNQPVEDIVQNIFSVVTVLSKDFPGGWENVSAVYIKTPDSLSIPVHVSLRSPNDVPLPHVPPRRPASARPVKGRLSTRPGAVVTVYPSGHVVVKRKKRGPYRLWTDEERAEHRAKAFRRSAEGKLGQKVGKPANADGKKATKGESKIGVEDEDQVEAEVVNAEESYLQRWRRERDHYHEEKKKMEAQETVQEAESAKPKRKRVRYEPGEMCLGKLGSETSKPGKSRSGGMARSAFQDLKSKMSKKKHAKKQKTGKQTKSIVCSNKSSKGKKKKIAKK
ncbi:ribosomal L1 domain-containing protein 1-like [Bacillus rossius redtenbacheri]|uniref:ribosomal L1 domain-containing protein 1-like n=1 Tax=Bacillus rossius redtenbacheri TaxID=93214 RepID=UPI002FDCF3B1